MKYPKAASVIGMAPKFAYFYYKDNLPVVMDVFEEVTSAVDVELALIVGASITRIGLEDIKQLILNAVRGDV